MVYEVSHVVISSLTLHANCAVSCHLIYAPLFVFDCIHDRLDDATILYLLMHEEGNV